MDEAEFKIELIFTMYKDHQTTTQFMEYIKDKYKLDDYELTSLRIKIVNYQIETYGSQLTSSFIVKPYDIKRISINAYQRKKRRMK